MTLAKDMRDVWPHVPHCAFLSDERSIVLASGSPRRQQLFAMMGWKPQVIESGYPELLAHSDYGFDPVAYSTATANGKTRAVYDALLSRHLSAASSSGESVMRLPKLIVGADTIITLDGRILEKPSDTMEAKAMLKSLAGRRHSVHTCVSLLVLPLSLTKENGNENENEGVKEKESEEPCIINFSEVTHVELDNFPVALVGGSVDAFLDTYLCHSTEAMDKSAACAYQGMTAIITSSIHGCYYNSLGFPIRRFILEMDKLAQKGVFLS